nr:substrate-binding domain-containing protein [Enterobacter asburiae]
MAIDDLRLERWQKDRDIFVKKAESLGASVFVQSANGNEETQMSQIENMINRGVDVLVIIPYNGQVLSNVVKEAKQEGIKVLAYDRMINNADIDYYISFDNEKVGELQAQSLIDKVPQGNYFLMGGSPVDNNAKLFREGQMKVLKPYIDNGKIKVVGDQWADGWLPRGIAMVPEDRKKDGIVPVMAVGKNITLAALDRFSGALSSLDDAAEQQCILQSLARLKVKTSSPELAIGRLSGGNQQKAILARCLLLNPRILILDEPTRGIDIGAKYEIYKLINQLVQQGIAVIVISSELPEVLGLSDRVLVMHEGKLKANLINQNLTQEQVMEAALRSERHVEKQSV